MTRAGPAVPRARLVNSRGVSGRSLGRVHRHRGALALELQPWALLELRLIAVQQRRGAVGEQDRVARLAGRCLDSSRDVDRVADHAELEPPIAAYVPRDDGAGVEAQSDLQRPGIARADDVLDLERGGQGLVGVVGLTTWSAEHGQQPVADELVDPSAVGMD